LYGMGGGNGNNGLKALNTGWQVWGSTTTPPSSKRNASMSSLASVSGADMQGDSNFRSNVGEPWAAPRSASGAWDDNALKKDFSALDPQSHLNIHQPRQRQSHGSSFPATRADDRPSKNSHINIGKDSNPPRYSSSSKSLGAGTYPGQQPSFPLPALGYDSLQPSNAGESDLTLAMRGMAVEDDFNSMQSRQPPSMPIPAQVSMRGASSLPQQRSVYNAYPTSEYSYYPPGRDSFADYPYVGYASPDPGVYGSSGVPMSPGLYPAPTLHPNTVDLRQQQPTVYFDYNTATRPPSQFFFPPQAMMYPPPHSPMLSPQLPVPSSPVTLLEKKHEMQVGPSCY
ncbi:hypothetical protein C8R43DRAFT_884246, partial [Mycena crocata]